MSPHTAHNCDGLNECIEAAAAGIDDVVMLSAGVAAFRDSLLLFAVDELLLFMQFGELDVDALCMVFIRPILGFGLSLLDVDSERCSGNEDRRCVVIWRSGTVGKGGNE